MGNRLFVEDFFLDLLKEELHNIFSDPKRLYDLDCCLLDLMMTNKKRTDYVKCPICKNRELTKGHYRLFCRKCGYVNQVLGLP